MTDNEIIKALEDKTHKAEYSWVDSSYCDVEVSLLKNALDLINQQQETIKTLRNCVEQHHIIRKDGKSPLSLLMEEIKSKAIKEFAERLKKKTYPFPCAIGVENAVTIRAIDNLVKEMVGDTE